jgi:hypothetical protein
VDTPGSRSPREKGLAGSGEPVSAMGPRHAAERARLAGAG